MKWIAGLFAATCLCAQTPLPPEAQRLLDRARAANPQRFQFALDQGARILPTSDERSFYVLWTPPGVEHPPLIATLHGDTGWAFDEIWLWSEQAQRFGYGILALQWWTGTDDSVDAYYAPADAQREVSLALRKQQQAEGTVLLHGFSRGGANVYAVEAADRQSGDRFYAMVLANSGGASADFPPNGNISNGNLGYNIFSGTYWATFCGGQDPNPDRDGCLAMRRTAAWIGLYGGVVDLVIEDEKAGHGGFHQTPDYIQAMLEAFRRNLILRQTAPPAGAQWKITRDEEFAIAGASTPNAGYVNGEVWLVVGGRGGPRLYRSPDGSNSTIPETLNGLSASLTGTGYSVTEVLAREDRRGNPLLFVLGLAPPGVDRAVIYRLDQGAGGEWQRTPPTPVYAGASDEQGFLGVPDVTPTIDGRLRLTYVARGARPTNSRTAVADVDGLQFVPEFNNPFGDLAIPNPRGTDLNVDPAVLQLASGGYLAVTMRGAKLYLHTSLDGRTFAPSPQPAIQSSDLAPDTFGLFDPTLVQLPDGRIFLYATAGLDPAGTTSRVVRAKIEAVTGATTP